MKEFNYEQAKVGAPVCTRDGRPARIVCWDFKNVYPEYSVLVLIEQRDGTEGGFTYNKDGKRQILPEDREMDLMMAPTKQEGWLYLYHDVLEVCTSHCVFRTKEDASKAAREIVRDGETQIIKIEWEE